MRRPLPVLWISARSPSPLFWSFESTSVSARLCVQARAASAASRLTEELQAAQKRGRDAEGDAAAAAATAAFHKQTAESMRAELTELRGKVARQKVQADTAGAAVGVWLHHTLCTAIACASAPAHVHQMQSESHSMRGHGPAVSSIWRLWICWWH